MKKVNLIILALVVAAVTTACSAKVETGSGASPKPATPETPANPPEKPANPPATKTAVDGKWSSNCYKAMEGMYISVNLNLSGANFDSVAVIHSNETCTNPLQSQTKSGTFAVGGKNATNADATDIDMTESTGQKSYDIFVLSGNKLYFSPAASETAATRPTVINYDLVFTKN